jgi:F-type H+-transporting ATPase subunit b
MQAFAADAANAAAAQAEPFFHEPEFWVAIAFVILIAAIVRPVYRIIVTGLDNRAQVIRSQIEEAERLRDEAQELLASYERRQRDAMKEGERLLEQAREEAERLSAHAADDLERSLKRREQNALERIAQAEESAVAEVRAVAIEVAISAARKAIEDNMSARKANALIDGAIKELPQKLH